MCLNKKDQESLTILNSEVEHVINSLKKNKAPGPDQITNEMIIYGDQELSRKIGCIFNRILLEQYIPKQWKSSKIILLHKKGPKHDIKNYRPISLSSIMYKLFAKIIQLRFKKIQDENQPEEQAGFRPSYSTMDHLHSVNLLLEKGNEYNVNIYLALIDYSKAFDSIKQSSILEGLDIMLQVDPIYINIISHLYNENKAYISLERDGQLFEIKRGTKQGCPLSPDFFNNVLEMIFRGLNWENLGVEINGTKLNNLRFADDVVLIASSKEELETMIIELSAESVKHGLSMNYNKTKILTKEDTEISIKVNGEKITSEPHSIYLGQTISFKNQIKNELSRRLTLGWKKFWSLKHIMKNKSISRITKAKVIRMCIFPTILYGCQVWALTKALENKLHSVQYKMMRSAAYLTRADRVRNIDIVQTFNLPDIVKEAKKIKWRWAGHISRMKESRWAQKITTWIPYNHKRSRGRKKKRWVDEIKKAVGTHWMRLARDRKQWEHSITSYYGS